MLPIQKIDRRRPSASIGAVVVVVVVVEECRCVYVSQALGNRDLAWQYSTCLSLIKEIWEVCMYLCMYLQYVCM